MRGLWRWTPRGSAPVAAGSEKAVTKTGSIAIWSVSEVPWDLSGKGFIAGVAGKFFFPLDRRLEIGVEGYSPEILEKIEYAGGNAPSFEKAAKDLKVLAGLMIEERHVQRLTERFGAEREAKRDAEVELMKRDKLEVKSFNRPEVCAVYVDAGKAQTRADDGKGAGVRGQAWADTKVACLVTYQAREHAEDPQPELPSKLMDRQTVKEICRQMALIHGKSQAGQEPAAKVKKPERKEDTRSEKVGKPEPLVRTAVATQRKIEEFGWMVAAEAQKRGFYEAPRKAVVGDGGNWIEPFGMLHFPGWTQVLDFMHGMTHLYGGASAAYGKDTKEAWEFYKRLVARMWKGETGSLIRLLENQVKRIGRPLEDAPVSDPRKILSLTLDYVRRNAHRMDYPSYRKAGLPISSAPVESLIKQFNQRVKGTEKFWHRDRLEAVLQSRAAYLSEDRRAKKFWNERKCGGRAVGRNRLHGCLNPVA
jgi:hypothetical protein